ncbi:28S ribosomal protein S27, mitochondrial-like [Diaphorina citri]|uniref:28S ribosomal protein S27, mitochondrial-like n=1 Tax=Diaphorina citri TaxID=121845 RepID=A0A3Q0JIZ7_DIACI|nr:28S ribosomal protein S27, mitochondrial-like [Diaphorina citri]
MQSSLKLNKTQELLEILDDRLNYGVFPDEYCNNLLINHFIKTNNYRDASKIASLQMLQEDFSNEITKYFSLYSCLKYLQAPTPWNTRTEEKSTTEANDDDEDEVKVRVQYLRNPYFDGHFDLKTANELIGKTLITIGRLSPEDVLHQSYYLIGLGLTKDAKEAEQFLKNVESGKVKVALEGLELFKKYLTSADVGAPPSSSNESTPEGEKVDAAPASICRIPLIHNSYQQLKNVESGKVKVALEGLELFKKYLTSADVGVPPSSSNESTPEGEKVDAAPGDNQAIIGEEFQVVLDLAEKVKGSGVNVNLLEITENKVKEVVLQFEAQEIEKQKQKYKEWDIGREKILLQHLEKLKEEEIFQTIEEKKAELAKEEERIFFFDNENQIDLLLEEKYPPKEEVVVKKRNEFDGKRNLGRTNVNKSKKSVVDENYVPPDLHKPYNH